MKNSCLSSTNLQKTGMSSKIKISVEQKLKSLWMERVVDKSAFSVVHCNQIGQVKGTFVMNNIQSDIVT